MNTLFLFERSNKQSSFGHQFIKNDVVEVERVQQRATNQLLINTN